MHRRKRRAEKGSVASQEPSGRRTKIYSFETNILKTGAGTARRASPPQACPNRAGGRGHLKPAQISHHTQARTLNSTAFRQRAERCERWEDVQEGVEAAGGDWDALARTNCYSPPPSGHRELPAVRLCGNLLPPRILSVLCRHALSPPPPRLVQRRDALLQRT